MAEDYFRASGKRDDITVMYNTALSRVFGSAYYADALEPMCAQRGIQLNMGLDLIEVRSASREAVFKWVCLLPYCFVLSYSWSGITLPFD